MQLQIAKWGNSLALRLPASFSKKLHIKEGDSVEVNLNQQGELVLRPYKAFDKDQFMQNLQALQKTLPNTSSVIETLRNQERY